MTLEGLVWKQFTLYYPGARNTQFPLGCLVGFLPDFMAATEDYLTNWHFLFEPGCLVRFETEPAEVESVMLIARETAAKYGLILELGDIADSPTSAPSPENAGFDYVEETAFYGEDLCSLNQEFLRVACMLSLAVNKRPPAEQLQLLSKHIHLLCNAFGLNYAEESRVCRVRSERAAEFYLKVGRV